MGKLNFPDKLPHWGATRHRTPESWEPYFAQATAHILSGFTDLLKAKKAPATVPSCPSSGINFPPISGKTAKSGALVGEDSDVFRFPPWIGVQAHPGRGSDAQDMNRTDIL